MNLHHPLIRRFARGTFFVAVILALIAAPAAQVSAQSASKATENPRQLTEEMQEAFNKVFPLIDAKNWEQAIPLLQGALAKAKPDSYDTAVGSVILAQVYLQRNTAGGSDFAAAIPLLETAIRLAYHDESKILDFTFMTAQLYSAGSNMEKAQELALRWLSIAKKWRPDVVVFASSIMLQRAQGKDGKDDKELVGKVLEVTRKAMLVLPNPSEQLYQIQAIAYQLNNDFDKAAEIFEILVSKWPKNRQYWGQLYALYVNANQYLRAVLTLERAQDLGMLNTPKDYISRVGLYYNMSRYDRVCAILEQGLKDGTIESEANNYELLAASYQQLFEPIKAIETYRRAIEKFPKNAGKYHISITNLYWEMRKYPEALENIEMGLAAGDVENPGKLYMFAAYICFELRQFNKGLELLEKAKPLLADTPQARQEFEGLTNSIKDAIEREKKQAAAAAQPKK